MSEELQKKVERAVKLLQAAGKIAKEHGQPLEVAYSGGKDSDVILELTRMAGVEYRAIYKNTTIDPPRTIQHAKEMGAEMMRPTKSFRELIALHGFPSRVRRLCCSYLKEYKVLDYCVIGVRREESKKRAERYKEPEVCLVYSKKEKVRQYLETHPNAKSKAYFHNVYEWLTFDLFCDSLVEFRERFGANLFNGGIDCKEFLENYFKIEL